MEGALFAAACLRVNGWKPLLVDVNAIKSDDDHVICAFQKNGFWGAIGKTNHSVLRYREPIYKNIRELVMSFFHEYFDDEGKKNMRRYSEPFDITKLDHLNWMASEEDIWFVHDYMDKLKHFKILTKSQIAGLRKADQVELDATDVVEWKREEANLKKQ